MQNYFSKLDEIIDSSQSIISVESKEILKSICFDKEFLRSCLKDSLQSMIGGLRQSDKKISSNVLLLKSIAGAKDNNFYLPAISFHNPGKANSIVNHSIYSILTPVNADVDVDKYVIQENFQPDVFDPNTKLSFVENLKLSPGDILEITPGKICYHFKFNEPTLFLKLQSQKIFVPFEWSFDVESLQAWQCIATEPKDSYAHHLCMAAGELADERLLMPLSTMLRHDRHQVRWAAMQALGNISYEHTERALHELSHDSHPHVKNAVNHMLEKMAAKEALWQ